MENQKISQELQEIEDEQMDGHKLKTNEEIIDMIAEFGSGVMEFHSVDINRIVVENDHAKRLISRCELSKLDHEIPNDNASEYNQGYVKAMCHVINSLKDIF